jgi:hypothetical protein
MSKQHTQTPWKWHPKSKDQAHTGSVYAEHLEGHAYAVAMMPRYQTDERWAADATLIVRAVNNHDKLVKALEHVLNCANAAVGADASDPDASEAFDMWEDARRKARALLAEVRGK